MVGVHRSGTSLLTRMLEALGVFVGSDLQGDHESRALIALNNLYFEATDSSWDAPRYPGPQELADNVIRKAFLANRRAFFARFGTPRPPWAMKDPRFVVTLPLWRAVFPASPIILLRRSPLDVARSLWRRHCALVERGVFPAAGTFTKGRIRFTQRCATFEGALSFALEQVAALDRLVAAGLCPQRLEISYEGLCQDPVFEIWNLCRFLRLRPTRDQVLAAAALPRATPRERDRETAVKLLFAD